jgi:hypothetical protein
MLEAANAKLEVSAFEVSITRQLAGRFSGSKTFIQELEKTVVDYYDHVGRWLKPYQPDPPSPRNKESLTGPEVKVGEQNENAPTATPNAASRSSS